jgi:hypothetical protein
MGAALRSLFAVTSFSPQTTRYSILRSEGLIGAAPFETVTDAIEIKINDRRGVESKHLAKEQTSGDGNTERPA